MYRIGVDVGGTNTDAVLMAGDTVLALTKTPTTADVTGGIIAALREVLAQSGATPADVGAVIVGTTHFTNAVIERRHMSPTAVVRLCLPATQSVPPLIDWPDDLRAIVGDHIYLAAGGQEFDGRAISPLAHDEIARIGKDIAEKGITAIAVCSVFAPVSDAMEAEAGAILAEACPGARVTLSAPIGRLGLLERENAAVLNASLLDLATRTVDGFREALRHCELTCPFYVSQNDGTLMDADQVQRYPVLTFASGPTNSMRGAVFLSGHKQAVVIDIGGTTTDAGLLQHGFPRQSSMAVDIGGVRTNFRMPDLFSIGLGGGSLVSFDAAGKPTIGPKSVGFEITTKALVFGGDVLTATDIAVAAGAVRIGDPAKVAHLDPTRVQAAMAEIETMLSRAIDRCRVSAEAMPIIVVGGGSILAPARIGDQEILRPANFAVANAIGAAIAQTSGEIDKVYSLDEITRDGALADAEKLAREKAVAAGAIAETITVTEREDVPLAYLPGNATRVRVKVVGDIKV